LVPRATQQALHRKLFNWAKKKNKKNRLKKNLIVGRGELREGEIKRKNRSAPAQSPKIAIRRDGGRVPVGGQKGWAGFPFWEGIRKKCPKRSHDEEGAVGK